MLEPGGELDLAQEAFRPHRGGDLGVEHLERNRTIVPRVVGQEHRSGPPAGQLALDPIALPEARSNARQEVYGGELNPRRHSFPRPYRGDQRLRLGGRFGCVLLGELERKRLIGLERAGAVTMAVEQRDEATQQGFIVRRECDRSPGPVRGGREVAPRLALLDQCPRRAGCRVLQPGACGFEPTLEVGRVRDEEPLQERTAVQVHGLERLTGGDRLFEGTDIRPHLPEVQAEVLIPAADDDPRAEGAAKHTERLTQCRTRVLLVELWPEEREQAVAAVEAGRRRRGEVGEESKAPGLAEERPHLASVGTGEAQSPEHAELDHARPRWRTRRRPEAHASWDAVTAGVTLASQGRYASLLNWLRKRNLAR